MAELDRATAAVGEMRTGSDRPTLDMETAMQELARIAQRSARLFDLDRENAMANSVTQTDTEGPGSSNR